MKRLIIGCLAVCGGLCLAFSAPAATTAQGYVSDNLIHQYDGIDNAGVGQHADGKVGWKDLVGNIDLSFYEASSSLCTVTPKSVGNANYYHNSPLRSTTAIDKTSVKAYEVTIRAFQCEPGKDAIIAQLWKDYSGQLILRKDGAIGSDVLGYFLGGRTATNAFTTVTVLLESGKLYLNGVEAVPSTATRKPDISRDNGFGLGGRPESSNNSFQGEVFACRVYGAELTPEQVAANAAVDADRFYPHHTCYVVPGENLSTPTPPYASWETAAASLADALDVVTEGWGELILSNGTHHISRPTTEVTGEIAIRGFGGREKTIIDADGSYPPFYLNCPEALLTGLTIQNVNNPETLYGSVDVKRGRIEDCIVRNNVNKTHGSGVHLRTVEASMSRCIVTNNTKSSTVQGGVKLDVAGIVIDNCYIADNYANYGETVHAPAGAIIRNCTLGVGKSGVDKAFSCDNNSHGLIGTFVNCAFLMQPVCKNTFEFHLTNCAATGDIDPAAGKAGSTVDDLKVMTLAEMDIIDSIGTIGEGSGLIDNGVTYAGIEGSLDLVGNPRVKGDAPDIGCSECQSTTFAASFTCSATQETVGNAVRFTAQAKNAPAGAALEYIWTFTACGETVERTVATAETTFDCLPPGPCTVSLVVHDTVSGASTAAFVKENTIFVRPVRIYVKASGDEATPVAPYDTEAKALATIADAVAWCAGLDDIEIALLEGTHYTSGPMRLETALTVTGLAGRELTIVDANQTDCPFVLNHPRAVVRGLTVENAKTENYAYSGGLYIDTAGGRIEDCIIRNNTSGGAVGYGTAVRIQSAAGSISRCIVTNNLRFQTVRGGVSLGAGARCDNCYIALNQGGHGSNINADKTSVIANCTFGGTLKYGGVVEAPFGNGQDWDYLCGNFVNCAFLDAAPTKESATCTYTVSNCASQVAIDKAVDSKVMTLDEMDLLDDIGTIGEGSALIDRGVVYEGIDEALDLAGNPRVKGSAPDIGCSECQNATFSASFTASATQVTAGSPVTFVAQARNAPADAVLAYDWTFTACGVTVNKTVDTAEATFDDLPVGPCTVTLVIRDTAGGTATAPFVKENGVFIRPVRVYVKAGGQAATPVAPYDTEAKALASIDEAVAWCAGLDDIEIALLEGRHTTAGTTMVLTTGITIAGVYGCARTILDGDRKQPPFALRHPGACIKGLTIENIVNAGATAVRAECVGILDGHMEDCVIRNNTNAYSIVAVGGDGTAHAASMSRCIVTNNFRSSTVSGAVKLVGAVRIDNCYIADNDVQFGGTLSAQPKSLIFNCTLGDCKHITYGALPFSNEQSQGLCGTFVNCAFLVEPTYNAANEFHVTNCASTAEFDVKKAKAGSTATGTKVVSLEDMKVRAVGRIGPGSKLINEGLLVEGIGEFDLFGLPRVSGGIPDIGCSERQQRGLMLIVR